MFFIITFSTREFDHTTYKFYEKQGILCGKYDILMLSGARKGYI